MVKELRSYEPVMKKALHYMEFRQGELIQLARVVFFVPNTSTSNDLAICVAS